MFCPTNMLPAMQTVCSCLHCSVNQALTASSQARIFHNYPAVHVVPTPVVTPQPRPVCEPSYVSSADRTLYLWKSVYKLVFENIYLALTDSKLLGWYLALSPEDRKIVQDLGGFHCFLRKHPALELSKHHIYVKKVVPEELKAHFPLSNNSHNNSNQHFHSTFNNPALQRVDHKVQSLTQLTWPMANSCGFNAANVANMSLDVELERHTQMTYPHSSLPRGCHAVSQEVGHETSVNEDPFYSILEADNSIVLCIPKESPNTSLTLPETCVSTSETSTHGSVVRTTEDRGTSPLPSVYVCDAKVGTEPILAMSALSQTESPTTADKNFNTEVYMLDLDYLTQEFIAIKNERDELLEKLKMKRTTSPFAKMVNDLKKLETDYNKMKEKVLSGISLKDLKPLSYDSEEAAKDSTFAKIFCDNNNVSLGSQSQGSTVAVRDNNSQVSETMTSGKDPWKMMRAVARVPKEQYLSQKTENKASDINSNETWYDAEEDLSSGESGEQSKMDEKPEASDTPDDKPTFMSAALCVSGLPINATEDDVLMWFKQYHASEVHISKLKELNVAIVIVKSRPCAEAAVKELNGLKIKGNTLQVEHINSGQSEDQGQTSTCVAKSSTTPNRNQNPLASSVGSSPKKKVVCVSPTAQGTFVPQHYGTMGSFDILMSELTQRHPDVGRQRIVDALLELRTKYRGVLSGLPLRTIRDMTSELLIRPACNTSN